MSTPRNRLSDPGYAAFAWHRYRTLMRWMSIAALGAALLALVYLWLADITFTITLVVATVAGVAGSVLLGTALMGLVFLSSGTGHDDDVADFGRDE